MFCGIFIMDRPYRPGDIIEMSQKENDGGHCIYEAFVIFIFLFYDVRQENRCEYNVVPECEFVILDICRSSKDHCVQKKEITQKGIDRIKSPKPAFIFSISKNHPNGGYDRADKHDDKINA